MLPLRARAALCAALCFSAPSRAFVQVPPAPGACCSRLTGAPATLRSLASHAGPGASMPPKRKAGAGAANPAAKAKDEKKAKKQGGGAEAEEPVEGRPWYSIWVSSDNTEYRTYMEHEWGWETHGDDTLFEMLILEGAQAGLSWATILRKRENYRRAFGGFGIAKVAAYDEADYERLMQDGGIVKNKLKIRATIKNAQVALQIQKKEGSLDKFLWGFVGGAPRLNRWATLKDIPCETPEAEAMSEALKARGMSFVGPKICYAFMQAVGMVVDHPLGTPQWQAAEERLRARESRESVSKKRAKQGCRDGGKGS